MGVSQNYVSTPPSLIQQQDQNMNLSMLYYSFFVVATAGVLLALYHCLVVNWCARSSWHNRSNNVPNNASVIIQSCNTQKVMQLDSATFEYKKNQDECNETVPVSSECAVCLSIYEEGEEIRILLRCNHYFHAHCIDIWLYAHFECPLCRAPVGDLKEDIPQSENLTAEFSDPSMLV